MITAALLLFFSAQSPATAAPVVVTGCLTAATVDGQQKFTLTTTDTNRAAADVLTETYQLTAKNNIDLKPMVGRLIEATGTESTVDAETTTIDKTHDTAKPAGTSGKTPTVETKTRANIVVHQMSVTAAKPVAGECRVP